LALVDLYFAEEKIRKQHTCKLCLLNPSNATKRNCQEPGFNNLKKARKIDNTSLEYAFCPGKATWFEEIQQVFEQCRVAFETGLLPKEGSLEDQDEMFAEVFYSFVEHWTAKRYASIWGDIREYTKVILKSIFGDGKGK
jgi:hypothetical protein